jgi:hypothetical protein
MKRALTVLAIVAIAVSTAHASIKVNWSSPNGLTRSDGTTGLLDGGSALFQLIYSSDGAIPLATVGGGLLTTGLLGTYNVLSQFTINASDVGDSPYAEQFSLLYNPGGAFVAGSVYMRVFDQISAVGSAAQGTWYLDSILLPLQDKGTTDAAQDLQLQGGSGFAGTAVINQNNTAVVPEPSVFAFLGIGGLLVAVRRMRKA